MNTEQKAFLASLIGKKVLVKKGHPRAGETGTIKEFYPCIGITDKPGFLIEADEYMMGDFFIFSGKDVHILPNV